MTMTRRRAGRLILGAPVIAAAAASTLLAPGGAGEAAAAADPAPTPLARFLARQEEGLTSGQKDRLRKEVTRFEEALRVLRDFPMANDVPPAGSFRALRSKRSGSRS